MDNACNYCVDGTAEFCTQEYGALCADCYAEFLGEEILEEKIIVKKSAKNGKKKSNTEEFHAEIGEIVHEIEKGSWDSGKPAPLQVCPCCRPQEIEVSFDLWEQVKFLVSLNRGKEFSIHLQGEKTLHGYRVEDFTIPKQENSGASSKILREDSLPQDTIGILHSHGSMTVFFSATDHEYSVSQWPVNIVVNDKLEVEAVVHRELHDGQILLVRAKLAIGSFLSLEQREELKNRMKEAIVVPPPPPVAAPDNFARYFLGRGDFAL